MTAAEILPAAHDHIHVLRVELDEPRLPPGFFGSDQPDCPRKASELFGQQKGLKPIAGPAG